MVVKALVSGTLVPMLDLIAAQLLFGLCIPLHKFVLADGCSPLLFVALRSLLGGLCALIYAHLRHGITFYSVNRLTVVLVPAAISGIVLKDVCKYSALVHLPVMYSASVIYVMPMATAGIGWFFSVRTQLRVGMMAVLFFFLALLVGVGVPPALIALCVSVIAASYAQVSMHQVLHVYIHPISLINGIRMILAGVIMLPVALTMHGVPAITDLKETLCRIVITSFVSTVLCHGVYLYLLRRYDPVIVACADTLGPLCATMYGWMWLGDVPPWHAVAPLFVLCCMYLSIVLYSRPARTTLANV